jgi:hypothetical protein
MVDVDPTIWDNPTLGQAANGQFLDMVEAEMNEKRDAAIEGRKPRELMRRECYPGYEKPKTLSSFDNGIAVVESPTGYPDPVLSHSSADDASGGGE